MLLPDALDVGFGCGLEVRVALVLDGNEIVGFAGVPSDRPTEWCRTEGSSLSIIRGASWLCSGVRREANEATGMPFFKSGDFVAEESVTSGPGLFLEARGANLSLACTTPTEGWDCGLCAIKHRSVFSTGMRDARAGAVLTSLAVQALSFSGSILFRAPSGECEFAGRTCR